jgi:transcriptional regulator with XRE-family HTH domain
MSSTAKASPQALSIGERVTWQRKRLGMSRKSVAELLGRSEEWLRLLEVEGRGTERLGTLVDLARVMRLSDLSALTGYTFTATPSGLEVPEHPAVPEIRLALSRSLLTPADPARVCTLTALQHRVDQAWAAWRESRRQYTALGILLPELLTDAIHASRIATAHDRRVAHTLLAHSYMLGQRFAYCVGAADLATQCTDRALLAAHTADDPGLLALAGWTAAMSSLVARRPAEAAELSLAAAAHVTHPATWEQAALRGSLLLFAAMGTVEQRKSADAWRFWDEASLLADHIGHDYQHPYTQFSGANVANYGVALEIESGNASAAVNRAGRLNPGDLPSTNRRATYYIDLARGHERRGEREGVLGALLACSAESEETIAFSGEARQLVTGLIRAFKPRHKDHHQVAQLAARLGIT